MSDKPHALALAETLERCPIGEVDNDAAAELRRLQAQNEQLMEALRLAEAFLAGFEGDDSQDPPMDELLNIVRTAIAAAAPEPR